MYFFSIEPKQFNYSVANQLSLNVLSSDAFEGICRGLCSPADESMLCAAVDVAGGQCMWDSRLRLIDGF